MFASRSLAGLISSATVLEARTTGSNRSLLQTSASSPVGSATRMRDGSQRTKYAASAGEGERPADLRRLLHRDHLDVRVDRRVHDLAQERVAGEPVAARHRRLLGRDGQLALHPDGRPHARRRRPHRPGLAQGRPGGGPSGAGPAPRGLRQAATSPALLGRRCPPARPAPRGSAPRAARGPPPGPAPPAAPAPRPRRSGGRAGASGRARSRTASPRPRRRPGSARRGRPRS